MTLESVNKWKLSTPIEKLNELINSSNNLFHLVKYIVELLSILNYARTLEYDKEPDYESLRRILRKIVDKEQEATK